MLAAGVTGAIIGGAVAALARKQVKAEEAERQPVTVDELEQKL
jgi:hydrogenase small subunit